MISWLKKLTKEKVPFAAPILNEFRVSIKHYSSKQKVRRLLKERSEIFVEVGAGDKGGQGADNNRCYKEMRSVLGFQKRSSGRGFSSRVSRGLDASPAYTQKRCGIKDFICI
jgi:hypothetical protein